MTTQDREALIKRLRALSAIGATSLGAIVTLDEIIEALQAVEQQGFVRVPVEPTEAMLQGACAKHRPGRPMQETTPVRGYENDTAECPAFVKRRSIWSAMISAAQSQGGEKE